MERTTHQRTSENENHIDNVNDQKVDTLKRVESTIKDKPDNTNHTKKEKQGITAKNQFANVQGL